MFFLLYYFSIYFFVFVSKNVFFLLFFKINIIMFQFMYILLYSCIIFHVFFKQQHFHFFIKDFHLDVLYSLKGIDSFNRTTIDTTIVATTTIVRGNRFFSEWKEKMDCGRCVIGTQPIRPTILGICHISINFGLITFHFNQCFRKTEYSTSSTLCDHTID